MRMDKKAILEKTDFESLFLECLPKAKKVRQDQITFRCVFHSPDNNPSGSANTKTGLFHCFSCGAGGDVIKLLMQVRGCDFRTALHHLAERAGIKTTINSTSAKTTKTRCVAPFPYVNAAGKQLYRKVRYEPGRHGRKKEFFFFHGSEEKGRGCEAVPYRLHEIVKTDRIFILEGEAKADLLASWGLVATCLDSGAKSKWQPFYTQFFEGKEITIVPDNDVAGEGYLQTIATALRGKAKSIKVLRLPGLKEKQDILDWIKQYDASTPEALQSYKETFLKLAAAAPDWQPPASPQAPEKSEADDTDAQKTRGERGANLLFNNLTADLNFRLVRNSTGDCFAVVENELLNLQGQEGRDFLWKRYFEITEQSFRRLLKKDEFNTVIMGLCAKARFEGESVETPLRVAKAGNKFYFDLGRDKNGNRIVEIDPDKGDWSILSESPILFRRGAWQKPIPLPIKNGDPWKFFDFCNVSEVARLLVLVAVITALVPDISRPAIQLYGVQGSGKSFLAKMIKMLLDLAAALLLVLPPKEEDFFLSCYRHYIVPADNASHLSAYLSDVFCSVISGGYIERRTLHTTMDVSTIPINCLLIFTSINSSIHERPDLAERIIKIELQPINKQQRIRESVLLENFQQAIPEILGGMLDVLVKAMQIYPRVELQELPRMADWATWGYAIAEALGGHGEQFMRDYFENLGIQTTDMLDDNSLLSAISACMESQGHLSGTFKEVLNLLREDAQPALNDKSFPSTPRSLRRHLERVRVPLSDLGIIYAIKGKTSRGRIIEFLKTGGAPESSTPETPRDDSGDLPF